MQAIEAMYRAAWQKHQDIGKEDGINSACQLGSPLPRE